MRLFRRTPRSRFPADMLPWLETLGRFRLDSFTSRVEPGALWDRIAQLMEDAERDRDGFLADLAALVEHDRGGFATLGAAGVVWEIYGGDALDIPGALVLVDAGIAVKQARGLPGARFTGYEWERVQELRNPPERT
ncbi:hypothetical protein COUCH_34325 [Couchioplanes caeruleus]|uniref:hypothetical protein n=1 Tax=Couchioplanes caeruleus TaxID=56438 RepID=UPI0020C09898|nr:hypothetical protein [Couchioplanes caeruleus]UQU64000.1 hypothetical protein COUCH_34325 [Couchioplanes caeruleus]